MCNPDDAFRMLQETGTSLYWLERYNNPLLMSTWKEFALCHTAWAWLDLDASKLGASWQSAWEAMLDKNLVNNDMHDMTQAIFAWGDQIRWTPKMSVRFLDNALQQQDFDWSAIIHHDNIKPRSLAYHTVFALAANVQLLNTTTLNYLWNTVVDSPRLRNGQKDVLLRVLCPYQGSMDEPLQFNNTNPEYWLNQVARCTNVSQWLTTWRYLCETMEVVPTRALLNDYWTNRYETKKDNNEISLYQKVLSSNYLSYDVAP